RLYIFCGSGKHRFFRETYNDSGRSPFSQWCSDSGADTNLAPEFLWYGIGKDVVTGNWKGNIYKHTH
ncbi:MAG: hypothetical protein NZ735_00145, partial [Candidatus Marinimicrobia bacterium]|nr:hypothetical protein [Candidatus Neomarinimicrobiota bacterium]